MDNLNVSVGVSELWDAKCAGVEVAKKTLDEMDGKKPDFFLLFSTIHYEKYGGFKKFLEGVWEVLPDGTPLVGGTVAGFMSREGCFVHGAGAMAVSYPNMDVAVGVGRNTKRNPKKAARDCAEGIKEGLKKSKYKNKFLIDLISGPTIPKVPGFGRVNYINDKKIGNFMAKKGMSLAAKLGYGIGKEEDVIEELSSIMPDFNIVGFSSADDGKFLVDYQFIGNKVFNDAIVALGGGIDREVFIEDKIKLHHIKKFRVTETTFNDRIITKIENKPARDFFFKEILAIEDNSFTELGPFYYKTSYYFPFTFDEENKHTTGVGGILGSNVLMGHKIRNKTMILTSVSAKEIEEYLDSVFEKDNTNLPFLFSISSAIYIFILGHKIYNIKNKLNKKYQNIPYLIVQPMIENERIVNQEAFVRVHSLLNSLSFKNNP